MTAAKTAQQGKKKVSGPMGRPLKYRAVLDRLDDAVLYTPASISAFAERMGFIKGRASDWRRLQRQRIRIALGRFSNNHDFPDEGDGMVVLRGQSPTPGWFGWRWKRAIPASSQFQVASCK